MNYKKRQRDSKLSDAILSSKEEAKEILELETKPPQDIQPGAKEYIGIKELSAITGLSLSTIFRLMKEKDFPRLKIGRRVIFERNAIKDYLTLKYGSI